MATVGVRSTDRDREIERAMRAHPAGRALRAGGTVGTARPAVVPPAPLPAPPGRLRLTARGRAVAAVSALALVTGGAALTGQLAGGEPSGGLHLEGQASVVVGPGDTLWSIASSVAGGDDVRDVAHRIQQVNGLRGTVLVPGEVLRLP